MDVNVLLSLCFRKCDSQGLLCIVGYASILAYREKQWQDNEMYKILDEWSRKLVAVHTE